MTTASIGQRKLTAIEWQKKMLEKKNREKPRNKHPDTTPDQVTSPERPGKKRLSQRSMLVISGLLFVPVLFACSWVVNSINGSTDPFASAISNLEYAIQATTTFIILAFAQVFFLLEITYIHLYTFLDWAASDLATYLTTNPDTATIFESFTVPDNYLHYGFAVGAIALLLLGLFLIGQVLKKIGKPASIVVVTLLVAGVFYLNQATLKQNNVQLLHHLQTEYNLGVFKFES